ncbi:MAG: penicillin-binding protein 2 [Verrucomicrobiales bacterium]
MRYLYRLLFILAISSLGVPTNWAQTGDDAIAPTWETQRHARTFLISVPAPRGQIVDRRGRPLAQNKVILTLCLQFPTPLTLEDGQVLDYALERVIEARALLPGREININPERIIRYYKNRGVMPYELVVKLTEEESERLKSTNLPEGLLLLPIYARHYPYNQVAAHIIGYTGRSGGVSEAPIQNNDLLWPDNEGREGLEATFEHQLRGKYGQLNIVIDRTGRKASERMGIPPEPGQNVVTTLDLEMQLITERVLNEKSRRGAVVIMDPRNGDILAMASKPSFDPNRFIPIISRPEFESLRDDESNPLFPRAFRAAYPPGSVFKVVTAAAGVHGAAVGLRETVSCPGSFSIGRLVFRNWKEGHSGNLTMAQALTQSCNTWFYQVGIRTGADGIGDWATRFGLGQRSGIPLRAEAAGRVPDHEYSLQVRGRRMLDGDVANMSIGQGDLLVTPLQVAQMMVAMANGGTLLQSRLVRQVQGLDDNVAIAYNVHAKAYLGMGQNLWDEMRKSLVDVVHGGSGTASRARVPGIQVAGKTGTAQWGPTHRRQNAAWFAGFAPADNPEFAFSVVYEGRPGEKVGGGSSAAPIISAILKEVLERRKERGDEDDLDDLVLPENLVFTPGEGLIEDDAATMHVGEYHDDATPGVVFEPFFNN